MTGRAASASRPRGAVVVGCNIRALGVVRSLGRHGIPVWLLRQPHADQVARASRYVQRTLHAPVGSAGEQRDGLLEIASTHGLQGWALFPTEDESAAALARERERLSQSFTLTFPRWEVLRHAYHKRLMHSLAGSAGVESPSTHYPLTVAELGALDFRFPLILKPDAKPRDNRFTADKAWRIDDRAALVPAWREAAALIGAESVMVQELIPDPDEGQYSFAALCHQGVPLAWLVARRIRQYPREFGRSSSLVETVDVPEVEQRGKAIVEASRWDGLVEVEFKYDRRDRAYKLLDINGRVWTWHGLGLRAGIDFPYLAWRLANEMPVRQVQARPGVRWVRLVTDVPSALQAMRAGELSLAQWAPSLRGPRVGAVAARDDPLPAAVDLALTAMRAIGRRIDLRPSPQIDLNVTRTDEAASDVQW